MESPSLEGSQSPDFPSLTLQISIAHPSNQPAFPAAPFPRCLPCCILFPPCFISPQDGFGPDPCGIWQIPSSCCSHRQPGNGWGRGEKIACWNGSASKGREIYKMSNKGPWEASGLLILLLREDVMQIHKNHGENGIYSRKGDKGKSLQDGLLSSGRILNSCLFGFFFNLNCFLSVSRMQWLISS